MTEQTPDENRLIAERRNKLRSIRETRPAFPNDWRRKHLADDLQAEYANATRERLETLNIQVSLAGRIMAQRGPFLVIQDMSGRIQAYVDKETQADIKDRWGTWDMGDIVGVAGPLHKSGRGDLYVSAQRYALLVKSLRPLPEKHAGLTDMETRYRQRYVDLIMNPQVQKTFRTRSRIIAVIRQFLDEKSFIEVETPMLQAIPGGAAARPFMTHHNALDQDMYLRIAPELYLKRLVVGGFERVYEINRNFRNEGLSSRHNPEFTMLEFYQAYATYEDLMDLTEELLRHLALEVLGATRVISTARGTGGEPITETWYEFGEAFARMSVFESILAHNPELSAADISRLEAARKTAEMLGIPCRESWGLGKLQIEIFEKTVEHHLVQPTFITRYPSEVSPLARKNDADPFVTDRFELFVGGHEIANGFSELNDAEDQAERFRAQVAEKNAGDDEAMHYDADYIRALEYGLPPTSGEGIGIDRLVMLLTDSPSIRDVLLFPAMRPE